jgi:polar amino acid transport system substrate-binding protein
MKGNYMIRHTQRGTRLMAAGAVAFALLAAGCGSDKATVKTTTAPAAKPADTAAKPADTAAPAAVTGLAFNQALFDQLPESIKSSKVMTLATDPTDPPLEFYDDKNVLVGAEVDMAVALGTVLGIEIKMVPSKFDAIIPGVEAGRFDGSMSGFADRKERQKVVDFVDYFTSSRGYLVKAGGKAKPSSAADLCGLKVAVAKGTTMAESIDGLSKDCETAGKSKIDSSIFPDQAACVLAVQSDRADVTILSDHAALWIAKGSNGELDVVLSASEGKDINGIVLKKGELVKPMQAAIQQLMDAGTMKEIFTKWNLQALLLDQASVNAGTN